MHAKIVFEQRWTSFSSLYYCWSKSNVAYICNIIKYCTSENPNDVNSVLFQMPIFSMSKRIYYCHTSQSLLYLCLSLHPRSWLFDDSCLRPSAFLHTKRKPFFKLPITDVVYLYKSRLNNTNFTQFIHIIL